MPAFPVIGITTTLQLGLILGALLVPSIILVASYRPLVFGDIALQCVTAAGLLGVPGALFFRGPGPGRVLHRLTVLDGITLAPSVELKCPPFLLTTLSISSLIFLQRVSSSFILLAFIFIIILYSLNAALFTRSNLLLICASIFPASLMAITPPTLTALSEIISTCAKLPSA